MMREMIPEDIRMEVYLHTLLVILLMERLESNHRQTFDLLRSNVSIIEKTGNEIQGEKSIGDNVVTTLDYELQLRAYDALGSYDGAVVVMEPATGKILAMVSKPDFDPNTISEDWDTLTADTNTDAVLLNRATQGLYPPGSTFKILTTLEYLNEHGTDEDYSYSCNGSFTVGNTTIHCHNNKSHGTQTLKQAFANSCNSRIRRWDWT